MKTTRTYLSGCTWCNARGYVMNPAMGLVTDITVTCPVCNGAKTIIVTEYIEDHKLECEQKIDLDCPELNVRKDVICKNCDQQNSESCKTCDLINKNVIEDGFGSIWSITCPKCGRNSMQVIRPGEAQCKYCG